jgi:hypothetical protein
LRGKLLCWGVSRHALSCCCSHAVRLVWQHAGTCGPRRLGPTVPAGAAVPDPAGLAGPSPSIFILF